MQSIKKVAGKTVMKFMRSGTSEQKIERILYMVNSKTSDKETAKTLNSKKVRTSTNPIGYFVALPCHIEESLGSYLENLTSQQRWTMLFIFVGAMESKTQNKEIALDEVYELCDGELPDDILYVVKEVGQIETRIPGTIEALVEALISNIRYTPSLTE